MILESLLSFDDELKHAYNAKEEYLIFDQVTKEELLDSIEESRKNMMLVQVEIPEGKKEDEEEFLA